MNALNWSSGGNTLLKSFTLRSVFSCITVKQEKHLKNLGICNLGDLIETYNYQRETINKLPYYSKVKEFIETLDENVQVWVISNTDVLDKMCKLVVLSSHPTTCVDISNGRSDYVVYETTFDMGKYSGMINVNLRVHGGEVCYVIVRGGLAAVKIHDVSIAQLAIMGEMSPNQQLNTKVEVKKEEEPKDKILDGFLNKVSNGIKKFFTKDVKHV